MSDRQAAIQRARDIVQASEWSGDMRVNMTTVIGAGRVLDKALAKRQAEIERLLAELAAVTAERDRARDECHRLWETLWSVSRSANNACRIATSVLRDECEKTSQALECTCTETAWHSACPIHGVMVDGSLVAVDHIPGVGKKAAGGE